MASISPLDSIAKNANKSANDPLFQQTSQSKKQIIEDDKSLPFPAFRHFHWIKQEVIASSSSNPEDKNPCQFKIWLAKQIDLAHTSE